MEQTLAARIRQAGIVGAGGAGFPSYVKASSKAEVVVMNAAECEPLLGKDIEILENFTGEVLRGIELLAEAVGAQTAVIGIKRKHKETVKKLEAAVKGRNIRIHPLGDFYPAGDEYCLVYETTGRLIPAGGIPLDVNVIVNNVETFLNIARHERPVTHTFVTVCGAVKNPLTFHLPIGTRFSEAIAMAGGATCEDFAIIDGGPMMGKVTTDLSRPVTKTTSGILVLPKTHPLIIKKAAGRPVFSARGRSACDQCSFCTMLCPRYLLGYNVEPHRVMRSLVFAQGDRKILNESALLCCECSLCSLYSCPENLDPRNMCVSAKADLREAGVTLKNSSVIKKPSPGIHPVREFRKVPVQKLVQRLGLVPYKKPAPLTEVPYPVKSVRLPFSQHIGAPASPCVSVGQTVSAGQKIADVPSDKLGVPVHASISGRVTAVTSAYIDIEA